MRKAVVWALILLLALLLSGCAPQGAMEKSPFSLDFTENEDAAKFFTQNDDINMLLACTPFYPGARRLPGEKTTEFYQARARKVDEIIANTDAMVRTGKRIRPKVDALRNAYFDYLTVCLKAEPNIEGFARYTTAELLALQVKESVAESMYDSISYDKIENLFARTSMQYVKVEKGNQIGALYLQDVEDIINFSALALESLKDSKDPKIQEAGRKLDSAMGAVDGMRGDLKSMIRSMQKVQYGFNQLATGDYYFSRAAIEYMTSQIPGLKEKVESLKPNADMSQADIDFIKAYLAGFENLNKGLAKYLDSVDRSKLIQISRAPESAFPAAYADQPQVMPIGQSANAADAVAINYSDAVTAMSATSRPMPEKGWTVGGVFSTGWRGVKATVHGAQSVVGAGIDVAGAVVKTTGTLTTGLWNKMSWKDMRELMGENFTEVADNWRNNMSGVSTLQTAKGYLAAAEKGGEALGSGAVSSVIGEGWTSWGVGKVSGMTVGLFTGFGKGVMTVANRQATTVDYVTGTIDVVGGAIGGSKIIIKGTQIPKFLGGLAEGSWMSGKGAAAYVMNGISKANQANVESALTKVFLEGGVKALREAEPRILATQALQTALQATIEASKARLKELLVNAAKSGAKSSVNTFRESITDFAKKQFTNTMKGVLESMGVVTGKGWDYVDNIAGVIIDDTIKGIIDDALREAPEPEEIAGVWKGTTTFTVVNVKEPPKNAQAEGCDMGIVQALKDLKGKPMVTYVKLGGDSSGQGPATIQLVNNGKGSPFPCRYKYRKDGLLEMSASQKGMDTKFTAMIRRTEDGYAMKGKATVTWGDSGTQFLYMAGEWNAEKQ